ncbi:MAG: apolipoprotein N-acyltransferase [Candidatus Firestonebacteria bacterium]|nr:apolipoprotein N-acyltransferase [Candidatus Firestonebacteria bacterium]
MLINDFRSKIQEINPFFLAGLSGILLAISFPYYNLYFVVWIALVPLLLALENVNSKTAFYLGYAQGLVFTIISLFWLRIFHFLALPAMLLVFSLYYGSFAWLYVLLKKHFPEFKVFLAACIWTSIEYLRGIGFLGFTWNSLGYSQFENIYLIQIVCITGIAGLSFLIVLTNVCITEIILTGWKKINSFLICIGLIISTICYGVLSVPDIIDAKRDNNSHNLKVGIVQGNFSSELTDDYEKIPVLKKLSSSFSNIDLIIWTETVLLDSVINNPIIKGEIEDIAKNNFSYMMVGNPTIEGTSFSISKAFNSVYLFDMKGKVVDRYDKIHLVPFGEVFPFHNQFEFIRQWETQVDCGGFEPGQRRTVFKLKNKQNEARFAALICFEGVFADLSRRFVKDGAQFLINITNDSWSKSITSHYQHAAMSIFRAVENRVYLLRAANTGISLVADPYGRVIKELGVNKRGIINSEIYIAKKENTFYTEYGEIFSQILVCIVIFFCCYMLISNT